MNKLQCTLIMIIVSNILLINDSYLFADVTKSKVFLWKGMKVYLEKIKSDEESLYGPSRLVFKNARTNNVVKRIGFDYGNFQIDGYYRLKHEKILHVSGYSGGESGCCSIDIFYYISGKKFISISYENNEYNTPTIRDVDGDGEDEILTLDLLYYGYTLDDKELKNGTGECSIETPRLFWGGFHEVVFPRYLMLVKNSKGEYHDKDVTFESKYKNLLKDYIINAERELQKAKGNIFDYSSNFQGYLQYYYYMTKLGREQEAVSNIKNSGIQIKFNCPENAKVESKNYTLYEIIMSYRNKLISNPSSEHPE